jgi:hypothetical protein
VNQFLCLVIGACLVSFVGCGTLGAQPSIVTHSNLQRAKIFLTAADYRRAIEACQQEVAEHPSAASYVYLTYVYHALDAYLASLAQADRWVAVEQLVRSLSSGRPDELIDSPDVLARIAKELLHDSAIKQADLTAAMATRLDEPRVRALWRQQQSWRDQQPERWWFGVPLEWEW